MKTSDIFSFENYVTNWFHDYLKEHEDLPAVVDEIFSFIPKEELSEDCSGKIEVLFALDATKIYSYLLSPNLNIDFPDKPDFNKFWEDLIEEALSESGVEKYSFNKDFIEDIIYHIGDYNENPASFFSDLQQGGCVSGMIGMFIYNDDCKKFYTQHTDDLESYIEELEEDLGEPIANRYGVKRYTFACWLCYEEFAHTIARALWEDEF